MSEPDTSIPIAAADGGRNGSWITVRATLERGRPIQVQGVVAPSLEAVLDPPDGRAPAVVALDVPIGLPAVAVRGGRTADTLARARLGPRASTVFSAPCRVALAAAAEAGFEPGAYPDVAEASASASPDGLRLSKQAFFLLPRIHEVDAHLLAHPDDRERVFEVHPELAFLALAKVDALPPKKTFRGQAARLRALAQAGLEVPEPVLALEEDPRASIDDVLDACACLWSAIRLARGESERLPAEPERDPAGLPMAIHF